MVPVKSVKEYDAQLDVTVLFSEAITKLVYLYSFDRLFRAIDMGYITQEQIDNCDPNVMIALPRLAIVWGLLYYPDGALNLDLPKEDLSEMFRHFHRLLLSIRDLLKGLKPHELTKLEISLVTGCSSAEEANKSMKSLEEEISNSKFRWNNFSIFIKESKGRNFNISFSILTPFLASVFTGSPPMSSSVSESSLTDRQTEQESSGLAYLSQSASAGIILPSTSKK